MSFLPHFRRTLRVDPAAVARHAKRDVDDELAFHFESRVRELVSREGLSREAAETRARAEFGDLERASHGLRRETRRAERGLRIAAAVERTFQDLRFATRQLRLNTGLSTVIILILAMSIGATTAIYSIVRGILLKPLAVPEPERVVSVWPESPHSPRLFEMLRDSLDAYESIAAWSRWTITLTGGGEPQRLQGAKTTAGYFRTLGVEPPLGRAFQPGDDDRGAGAVAVLSYGLWRDRFGADSSVVGRTITLQGRAHLVLGVMPQSFRFPDAGTRIWLPYELSPDQPDYRAGFLRTIARLAPGVSRERAQAGISMFVDRLHAAFPSLDPAFGRDATVRGLRDDLVAGSKRSLLLLLGAVMFLLVLAATNAAGLLTGRAIARGRELAVRAALGAGRGRLVRQLLTESLVLGGCGGGLGVAIAFASLGPLVRGLPAGTPRVEEIGVDPAVLGLAVSLTLGTVLVFGLLPALWATRSDLTGRLHRSGLDTRGVGRVRSGLVVAEIALGIVLMSGSGLLLRSLLRLEAVDPGFKPESVITLSINPAPAEYGDRPDRSRALFDRVLTEVDALPGVRSAGLVQVLPMDGTNRRGAIVLADRPGLEGPDRPWAEFRVASGTYFATLEIPLRRGRVFGPEDGPAGGPVAIVNQRFVDDYWPGQEAIGKRIQIPFWRDSLWHTVVGVVGDVRHEGLDQAALPEVYIPERQSREFNFHLVVASSGVPTAPLAPAIRARVWAIDPDVPVGEVRKLDDIVAGSLGRPRLLALLITGFGVVALLLGALGVYGVMAHDVRHRRRELSIRLALGAARSAIGWLVVRRALRLGLAGAGLGLLAYASLHRALAELLFQVGPLDPMTLALVTLLVLGVVSLSTAVPARRAVRVEPAQALRLD